MASAHGHLNNEVMNNNRPPAPKFRKWLMRNNKSSLSGLTLNKILLFYKPNSFHCKNTTADKQLVNEIVVEKLPLKLDFRLLKQFSVFLCKSVIVMTSLIIRKQLHADRVFPVYYLVPFISRLFPYNVNFSLCFCG